MNTGTLTPSGQRVCKTGLPSEPSNFPVRVSTYACIYCYTLQHTGTYCNTILCVLRRTVTRRSAPWHTATHILILIHVGLGSRSSGRDTPQHTATHCNALQHTAIYCNTLQHTATHCNTLQRTYQYIQVCPTNRVNVTHCNLLLQCVTFTRFRTLQHAAAHCNTLCHAATRAPIPKRISNKPSECDALQHTATHCNIHTNTTTNRCAQQTKWVRRTAIYCNILQHTATHCNTLQHTATHCNTLRHMY